MSRVEQIRDSIGVAETLATPYTKPIDYSSSIGQANDATIRIEPIQPTRPVLEPPDERHSIPLQGFASGIVAYINRLADIQESYINHLENDLRSGQATLSTRVSTHQIEEREVKKAVDSSSWWDSIREFFSVVLSVSSIVVGGSLISRAKNSFELLTGAGLVTSGGLTTASTALSYAGTHEDLSNALALTGGAIGLLAGASHIVHTEQKWGKFTTDLLIAAVSVSTSLATLGREEWARIAEELRAKHALTQSELEQLNYLIDLLNRDGTSMIKTLGDNIEAVSRMELRQRKAIAEITARSGPLGAV